jgi:hypothetical protein
MNLPSIGETEPLWQSRYPSRTGQFCRTQVLSLLLMLPIDSRWFEEKPALGKGMSFEELDR